MLSNSSYASSIATVFLEALFNAAEENDQSPAAEKALTLAMSDNVICSYHARSCRVHSYAA